MIHEETIINSEKAERPQKASSLDDLLSSCPPNQTIIMDSLVKSWRLINDRRYSNILCSVSGGWDSDIMLDICWKCDVDNKIYYSWYDTGIEYQATKDHLRFLEDKYNITINRYKPIKSIPTCCREYGQPFCSKYSSQMIEVMQHLGFDFEDRPYEELALEYPKNNSSFKWWCNMYAPNSTFNIAKGRFLKEFLIKNPPKFAVSSKCCDFSKKKVVKKILTDGKFDLDISGVRKSEGGIRAVHFNSCYDEKVDGCDAYRPLFWYRDEDKKVYDQWNGIVHSKCYTEYGLERTGCCGCPYGKRLDKELEAVKTYEPKLYKAVNNIFKDSYEYTRQYREYCNVRRKEERNSK